MSSKVFWIFFYQIKIPKRIQNAETFFQRELLLYVLYIIYNQFLWAIFKTKLYFQGDNLNLSLKITYKDKITDIKKIPCKITIAVNLPWCGNLYRFFANF